MKKELVPKDYKRSLEVIARENPTMTGAELLAEQEYDIACYQLYKDNKDAANLELIDKIIKERYYKIKYKSSSTLTLFLFIESARINSDSLVVISGVQSKISCHGSEFHVETGLPFTNIYKSLIGSGEHVEVTAITEEHYNKFFQSVGELFDT